MSQSMSPPSPECRIRRFDGIGQGWYWYHTILYKCNVTLRGLGATNVVLDDVRAGGRAGEQADRRTDRSAVRIREPTR